MLNRPKTPEPVPSSTRLGIEARSLVGHAQPDLARTLPQKAYPGAIHSCVLDHVEEHLARGLKERQSHLFGEGSAVGSATTSTVRPCCSFIRRASHARAAVRPSSWRTGGLSSTTSDLEALMDSASASEICWTRP